MPLSPTASSIVYFGDSLSDDGNLFAYLQGLIDDETLQSFDGYDGRFSDGPIHTDYIALIAPITVTSYAVASAGAIGSETLGEVIEGSELADDLIVSPDDPALLTDINLGAQIDRFLADAAGTELGATTGVILIGANDFGDIDTSNLKTAIISAVAVANEATDAILAAATDLLEAGLETVYVGTLPVAAFFPGVAGAPPLQKAVSTQIFDLFNAQLVEELEALAAQGTAVELLDKTAITAAIVEDPASFGILAPITDYQTKDEGAVLAEFDPDQIAFWDELHPTTAIHGVLAAFTTYALDGSVTALDDTGTQTRLGSARDLVLGYGGDDVISAGDGRNTVFAGSGDDVVTAGAGVDILSGGSGNDLILGRRGADLIDGDPGDDRAFGGAGDDVLIGGLGSDLLVGGTGQDTFLFTEPVLIGGDATPEATTVVGGDGSDTLYLALGAESYAALGSALAGPAPEAALQALGIAAYGIEGIVVLDGRDGLQAALGAEAWYGSADIWGLV